MRAILILATATAVLAALPTGANAQAAMARLQFEEAEAAFANNDVNTTLRKLAEAERSLGAPNPPILRLRITAREQYVRGNANYDFAHLEALRADCSTYTRRFANDNQWIDYTREIYPLCQRLGSYPATRAAHAQAVEAERQRVAQAQAAERARQAQVVQQQQQAAAAQRRQRYAQAAELRSSASTHEMKAGLKIIAGGLGLLGGGLTAMDPWDDEELYWGIGVAAVSGLVLMSGFGDIGEAREYNRRADAIERQASSMTIAPMYVARARAVGLVATARF